jgi:triphosphoribosyl-dephospho-CoA synthase
MRRVQRIAAEIDRIPLNTREPTKSETPKGETEWANCVSGQMALPTVNREQQTGSYSQSRTTRRLASLAVRALIEEAELTPKPALVDGRGGGAQEDLSVLLMRRSAHCLAPFFELIALVSLEQIPTQTLREELGTIGRWAGHSMLRSTAQINTRRGAIWALGLLVSAAAMGAASPEAIAETARQLACLPDRNASKKESHGLQEARPYRLTGGLAEAQAGFPSIIAAGLPRLHLSRQIDESETVARLNALLAIMTRLDDTRLLQQGGLAALKTAQAGAASILEAGGVATPEGWRLLQHLDRDLLALKSSPRGSADMLAATIFIDYVGRDEELNIRVVSPDRKS